VASPDVSEIEHYARAAGAAAGLAIDEAWWPGVVRHLEAILERAASLEGGPVDLPEDTAAVFHP
jgi:transcriptional regulator with GAF, ATPase, and Fis domain